MPDVGRRMGRKWHPVSNSAEVVVDLGFELRLVPPSFRVCADVAIGVPPVFGRVVPVAGIHRSGRPVLSDGAPRVHPVLRDDEHALPSLGQLLGGRNPNAQQRASGNDRLRLSLCGIRCFVHGKVVFCAAGRATSPTFGSVKAGDCAPGFDISVEGGFLMRHREAPTGGDIVHAPPEPEWVEELAPTSRAPIRRTSDRPNADNRGWFASLYGGAGCVGHHGVFGKAVESGRMSSSVLTSQVVVPTCPNLPHLGHTLPTFRTGFGRKNPARLPRNSAIIVCIGDQVGRGPLSCPEESAARCASRAASMRCIPLLAFVSILRRHLRRPPRRVGRLKKTEPNEGPEPTILRVRPSV